MRFRPHFSPLSAILGAILLASLLLPTPKNGAILGLDSPCPFWHLTHLPCPFCGLTRAFVCMAHGQFGAAFAWHPLGPILFALALFCVANALAGKKFPIISPRVWKIGALSLLLIWAMRLGGVFALPTA